MIFKIFKPYIEHSNMEDFIIVPKFYMSLLACWPLRKSKFAWVGYLYSFLTAYLSSILFAISLIVGIYQSMGDLGEVADASYFFMTEVCFLIKFFMFTAKRKRFLKLLDELENPLFVSHVKEQNKYLKSWSKISRAYSHCFFMSCYSFLVFCTFVPILDKESGIILPFKGWIPFDVQQNLYNRTAVYVFQLLCLLYAILVNASLDLLPSIFMNVACAQIEILKENLETATDKAEQLHGNEKSIEELNETMKWKRQFGDNYYELLSDKANEIVLNILKKCITHHEAIMSFLANVELMFTSGMFVQFVESGITICITGLQLIVVPAKSLKFLTIILYLLALTFQITCYCWNGHQSASIGDSCYNMDWYRCNTKVKKTIFIIMERCKRPIHMTAAGFFTLSIQTLTAILRSSYSYFAVLQRVYKD